MSNSNKDKLEEIKGILTNHIETEENPKMVQVRVEGRAYQQAFCFAIALEDRGAREPLLLATIISGADTTVQSIKGIIDTGTYGLSFGFGEKGLASYNFTNELNFFTDKGKYTTFPMSINNKKALAIIHDDILEGKYTMSFEENPSQDVRKILGGKHFGIPLLEEWADTTYNELKEKEYLIDMPVYFDNGIFQEGFQVLRLDFNEEQADQLISEMIKQGQISFPEEASETGESLESIENLTGYMENFNQDLIDKLSKEVEPGYNPLTDTPSPIFDEYDTKLFPVQSHVASGVAKHLEKNKSVIVQGEMSVGKSKMMTAIADAYYRGKKGKPGYFAMIMVPPSLTDKWSTEEIYDLLPAPRSKVILIKNTSELIKYHQNWIKQGRQKPEIPTFFVCSFTTIRSGAAIEPIVDFQFVNTKKQKEEPDSQPYRKGYICPDCGHAHQVIESENHEIDESGQDVVQLQKRIMLNGEFGTGRRLVNSNKPANAFCSECGTSLWSQKVPTRYRNFKEWVTEVESRLLPAIAAGDKLGVTRILRNQKEIKKVTGKPRRVATIDYIRRKMKGFFDVCIVDEIHELKSGATAQGNALGALVAASKKCVSGTGTLFGGKAEDIYFLMWRLFPNEMVKEGYQFSEVSKWNEEYGNIERTSYSSDESDTEFTNKQSRGGKSKNTAKVKPGISPFVFGRFLVQNTCLVRLLDVWPDPTELVDVPTIFVDMNEEVKAAYEDLKDTFDLEIEANRFRKEDNIPNLWLLYTETGISYLDNPGKYPAIIGKQKNGNRKLIWEPKRISTEKPLPKEEKLIEIIRGEISESRPSIVYVRDTGSTNKDRDIQPRLQKIIEENVKGAKVAILRSGTTDTDKRSKWVKSKIDNEGVNVIICSMELVKVGLDLLKTPTLIFHQFSWSMFTLAQAAKRAWRIGQTKECRLYYLAYADSFQEHMAKLIAQKNRASQAINGSVSSDGLNAMLGEDGDLQSMLIKSVKEGAALKGSTEEWIATTTDRAREILEGIGKKKTNNVNSELIIQLINWARKRSVTELTLDTIRTNRENILSNIQNGNVNGFKVHNDTLSIDEILAFGFDFFTDSDLISHLLAKKPKTIDISNFEIKIVEVKPTAKGRKNKVNDGQLAIDLFSDF
ncbi:helicase-related protein [Viridibacillus arvi]|uniref:helicase-related protein n=1 Tax=Viridibacillus arvi TaxID=263475 RepID=UPI0034CD5A76